MNPKKRKPEGSNDSSLIDVAEKGIAVRDDEREKTRNDDQSSNEASEISWSTSPARNPTEQPMFERQPRRKMRESRRLEVDTHTAKASKRSKSKKSRKSSEQKEDSNRKRSHVKKTNVDDTKHLHDNFESEHVSKSRITIKPTFNLGLFKKGRASMPTRGLPDLVFSEMEFLSRQGKRLRKSVITSSTSLKSLSEKEPVHSNYFQLLKKNKNTTDKDEPVQSPYKRRAKLAKHEEAFNPPKEESKKSRALQKSSVSLLSQSRSSHFTMKETAIRESGRFKDRNVALPAGSFQVIESGCSQVSLPNTADEIFATQRREYAEQVVDRWLLDSQVEKAKPLAYTSSEILAIEQGEYKKSNANGVESVAKFEAMAAFDEESQYQPTFYHENITKNAYKKPELDKVYEQAANKDQHLHQENGTQDFIQSEHSPNNQQLYNKENVPPNNGTSKSPQNLNKDNLMFESRQEEENPQVNIFQEQHIMSYEERQYNDPASIENFNDVGGTLSNKNLNYAGHQSYLTSPSRPQRFKDLEFLHNMQSEYPPMYSKDVTTRDPLHTHLYSTDPLQFDKENEVSMQHDELAWNDPNDSIYMDGYQMAEGYKHDGYHYSNLEQSQGQEVYHYNHNSRSSNGYGHRDDYSDQRITVEDEYPYYGERAIYPSRARNSWSRHIEEAPPVSRRSLESSDANTLLNGGDILGPKEFWRPHRLH